MKQSNQYNLNKLILVFFVGSCCLFSCSKNPVSSSMISKVDSSFDSSVSSSTKEQINLLKESNLQSDYVHWIGRTIYDENQKVVNFYYTATGFELSFYGTRLSVDIYAESGVDINRKPYFSVFIDDVDFDQQVALTVDKVDSTLVLAQNLEKGIHKVKFLKRSEPYDGITSIKSITTDGNFEKFQEKNNLKFQIVGASGISGHGALGQPNTARTTKNSSSLHAFGYLTARMFDAETQFVSNSGFGLVWGSRSSNVRQAYDKVGVDKNCNLIDSDWNHQSWIPDLVLVNIGGNDFTFYVNNCDNPTQAKKVFREAVIEFLTHIHSINPNAYVIWTHTGSSNGTEAASAISDYSKRKLVKVVVIPKVGSDGDPEGANGHNAYVTHVRTAEIIKDEIIKLTNYNQVYENVIA